MEEIQRMINEQMCLIQEDEDRFIFETIRTYTDGVLAHEGIFKIPKKLLERAITCFKMEHPAEFELLLNGDEGMKQKIVEEKEEFHCGVEESGFHAYNCNDCPNKCDEWYQWDKEISKCCPWYDMCIYKTATCRVRYPDNGCVLYRWFKQLISKEEANGIHED